MVLDQFNLSLTGQSPSATLATPLVSNHALNVCKTIYKVLNRRSIMGVA